MNGTLRPGDRLRGESGREYRIVGWHAEGSYAHLFRGESLSPSRSCALKVAKAAVDGAGARLNREIEIRRRFRHPGVPEFLDAGCADDRPFLASAWIEGPTLRAQVERLRRLPLVGAVRIARDVGGVVVKLHSDGLAHGDLRADNIILQDDPKGACAVVTDLGEARHRKEPGFEEAMADDLRSLGRLLRQMLTGVAAEAQGVELSRANGHHPEVVRLCGAADARSLTAAAFFREVDGLLRTLTRG